MSLFSPFRRSTFIRRSLSARRATAAVMLIGAMIGLPTHFGFAQEQIVSLKVAESWPINHPTHHVQGLAVTDESFWISSVDRRAKVGWVIRVDRKSLKVVAERKLVKGAQFHPGGIQLTGNDLWVPLAEYRRRSTSTMLRLDAQSLETKHSFAIDDHIGGVAVDGQGTVYAANWDCREIYSFDEQGKLLQRVKNPTGVAYQDIEWQEGLLLGTGRIREGGRSLSVVDAIDPTKWRHVRRYRLLGKLRSGGNDFGREGFTKHGKNFFLLPEDGPHTTVYRFPLEGP